METQKKVVIDMFHFIMVLAKEQGIKLPENFDEMSFEEAMAYLKSVVDEKKPSHLSGGKDKDGLLKVR